MSWCGTQLRKTPGLGTIKDSRGRKFMCFPECSMLKGGGGRHCEHSSALWSCLATLPLEWFSGSAKGDKIPQWRPCGQLGTLFSLAPRWDP